MNEYLIGTHDEPVPLCDDHYESAIDAAKALDARLEYVSYADAGASCEWYRNLVKDCAAD